MKDLRLKDYSSGEKAVPFPLVSSLQKGIFHTYTHLGSLVKVFGAITAGILE